LKICQLGFGAQALLTNIFTREGWAKDETNGPATFMFRHDRKKDL
jgi:hypothetical protein